MADYITQKAALEICAKAYQERLQMADYCGDTVAWNICADIKNLPAADVVPVVRCKECANFRQNAHGVCYCNEYGGAITPEDYCSRAVRESELPAR